MRSLEEDTLADKVVRFVIGVFVGALVGIVVALEWGGGYGATFIKMVAGTSVLVGVASVIFGNSFIEAVVRGRWWTH